MLNLYRITCWHCGERHDEGTFETFVIAKNKTEARKIVESEIWTISGMKVKSITKINMSTSQILVSINTEDLE